MTVHDYPDPIPAAVVARWTGARPDRVVLVDLLLLWATTGAVVLLVPAAVGLARHPSAAAAAVLVLLLVGAVAAVGLRRILTRRHVLLPSAEIDLVVTHRRELALDNDIANDSAPNDGALAEAARLAERAHRCAAGIKATRAWDGAEGELHRLQLDPDEEARQISVECVRVQQWHRDVARQVGADLDELAALLTGTLAAIGDRVEEFERCRAGLQRLSAEIEDRERAARARELVDRAAPAMTTATVRQELATDRLRHLRQAMDTEDLGR